MKKLTICIPTYNRSGLLIKTVQAFINQIKSKKIKDVEILVSDNCSTDGTFPALKKIRCRFLKIRKNKRNLGFSRNLIELISSAEGEYIWFFGDDDLLTEDELPAILEIMEKERPNFLVHNYFTFRDEDSKIRIIAKNVQEAGNDAYCLNFRELDIKSAKKIAYCVPFISANIVRKDIADKFSHDMADNNYWHFYSIVKHMMLEGKAYFYSKETLGQRITTSYFHENIELKYKTFFVDLSQVLSLHEKEIPEESYHALKYAYKKYFSYSIYTLLLKIQADKFSSEEISYVKKFLQHNYYSLYVIFISCLLLPKKALNWVVKILEFIREKKFSKSAK